MLSLAESEDGVSLRLESATVSLADAAGAGYALGVIPRKTGTQTTEKSTSGNCA
jgi:hypothetical protein